MKGHINYKKRQPTLLHNLSKDTLEALCKAKIIYKCDGCPNYHIHNQYSDDELLAIIRKDFLN